ncbi:MAG: hypothetical protein LBD14_05580 [Puniceicoccales bacterium]|nr:hypothetical protein [Puniceicoccales bacterium]
MLLFVLAWGGLPALGACGISWMMPLTPFLQQSDGDYHFVHWESWGEIKVSDKLTIPVHVGFSPITDRQFSRILGAGWTFPLLESICIPASKEKYTLILPDGAVEPLLVRPNNQLEGPGWLGQISGRSITLKAACGTTLTFRDGRLQQIKAEGSVLDFSSTADGAHQITANGRPVLSLKREWDAASTLKFHTLDFSGKHAVLKMGRRPLVIREKVSGGGKPAERVMQTESLVSVKFDGESERRYDFKPDGVAIGNHPYQWDAQAQLIRSGDEKYSFKQVRGIRCLQTDFNDGTKTIEGRNKVGTTLYKPRNEETIYATERVLFKTQGMFAYKTRRRIAITNGREEQLERYWYDENGGEIRSFVKKDGEILERSKNVITSKEAATGRLIWEKEYGSHGKIIRFRYGNKTYAFSYPEKEPFVWVTLLSASGKKEERKIAADTMNAFLEKL